MKERAAANERVTNKGTANFPAPINEPAVAEKQFANKRVIPELQTASRVICQRLRKRPYQRGVTITAWNAVVDQLLDGSRYGAFSWQRAVEIEVRGYIAGLDEETKRRIWESTEDAEIIPNASIDTITDCLYPHVFQATLPRIHRAVRNRERREGEPDGAANGSQPIRSGTSRTSSAAGSRR